MLGKPEMCRQPSSSESMSRKAAHALTRALGLAASLAVPRACHGGSVMLPACGLGPFHTRKASLDAVIILGALYVITGGFVNPIIATDRHTNKKAAITGWSHCCLLPSSVTEPLVAGHRACCNDFTGFQCIYLSLAVRREITRSAMTHVIP